MKGWTLWAGLRVFLFIALRTVMSERRFLSRAKGEVLGFAFPNDTLGVGVPRLLKRARAGVGSPRAPRAV